MSPKPLRIVMGLTELGEISGTVCRIFADSKGVTVEEDDYELIGRAALGALRVLLDRAEFARSVAADLEKLETHETQEEAEPEAPGE